MTGDAREDRQSGVDRARTASAASSRGRSDRPGSRSTAGSISISRPASPRLKRSGDSSSCSTPRKRATPARSIRSRRACCRSLSARRPRPCRSFRTEPNPTASACAGARKARPTTPKGRSSHARIGAPPRPRLKASCRASSATFSRRRRPSPRSASLARAPTISHATAKPSRSNRARSMSTGST